MEIGVLWIAKTTSIELNNIALHMLINTEIPEQCPTGDQAF